MFLISETFLASEMRSGKVDVEFNVKIAFVAGRPGARHSFTNDAPNSALKNLCIKNGWTKGRKHSTILQFQNLATCCEL
uniref:Uncharacterized protein n=1 Tax=Romanomermis culicivorax TaxID=13658 RepID=A0A915HR80_ROMCU